MNAQHRELGAGNISPWRLIIFDRWLLLIALLAATLLVVHIFPVVDQETMTELSYGYADALMLVILLVTLGVRLPHYHPDEKPFWINLMIAFSMWLIIKGVGLLPLSPAVGRFFDLGSDTFYFLFYLFVLFAIESRSLRPMGSTYARARFWLNFSGGVMFATGTFFYFILIPAGMSRAEYATWIPSFFFYLALDTYITIRFLILLSKCREPRWRVIYTLMLITSTLWIITDTIEAMTIVGWVDFQWQGNSVIWYLPYFPTLLAIRTRSETSLPFSFKGGMRGRFPHKREQVADRLLVVYAFALPMIHLIGYALGVLDETVNTERSLLILMWMFLMGGLSLIQYTLLHRRNRLLENLRLRNVRILEAIGQVQSQFIVAGESENAFENMVDNLLRLSESEFGFVGEVLEDENGEPHVSTLAVTLTSGDKDRHKFFRQGIGLEMVDLNPLFDAVIRNGEAVITDDLSALQQQNALPDAYGEAGSFMGIPLYHRDHLIGVFGIANRVGGYDKMTIKYLDPFFSTCASIISAFRNEREHKRMQEIAARFGRILDDTQQEIYIFDAETLYFVQVNRGARENIGYSSEELRRLRPTDLYPSTTDERLDSLLGPLKTGEREKIQYTTAHRRKDGSSYPVDVYLQRSTFEERTVFVAIVLDITERKRMEREKARLESQVIQSQKLETIGTLAGGIAHDFNNILAPIIWYTEMIVNDLDDDSEMSQDLTQVLKAANRAKDLVQQILTFGRLSETQRDPVQIQLVMDEAVKLLRASLPATIEIRKHIDSKCDPIYGDPTQIHQVIMNLCTNAFHAMRDHGGLLEVSLSMVTLDEATANQDPNLVAGSKYVLLRVKDTGHGMDPATVNRIFEPFFTTKQVGEGTGLGLSVIHGIVMTHGGGITVDSKPGNGSTFNVYFPPIDYESQTEVNWQKNVTPGNERIILVDDEREIAYTGKQMLERFGYEVEAFTDVDEALYCFRNNPGDFDLVITDQTMPNKSGLQLATELHDIRPDLPVILATGYSEEVTEERLQAAGITEFLLKPVIGRELHETIRRALDPKD